MPHLATGGLGDQHGQGRSDSEAREDFRLLGLGHDAQGEQGSDAEQGEQASHRCPEWSKSAHFGLQLRTQARQAGADWPPLGSKPDGRASG